LRLKKQSLLLRKTYLVASPYLEVLVCQQPRSSTTLYTGIRQRSSWTISPQSLWLTQSRLWRVQPRVHSACHNGAMEATIRKRSVVTSTPDIMSGTPVFVGTRVPIQNRIDYLEGGDTIEDFLNGFPTVSRTQVLQLLEDARGLIITTAERHVSTSS
jgi:uncharacterized protein (DUF433 family)